MTLQDQVSALKDGDYVRAEWKYKNTDVVVTGKLRKVNVPNNLGLLIGECNVLRYSDGSALRYLTSVTVIDPPLPVEPEVGSFGLDSDGYLFKRYTDGSWWYFSAIEPTPYAEIYPQIKKMWDKDGNEVAL